MKKNMFLFFFLLAPNLYAFSINSILAQKDVSFRDLHHFRTIFFCNNNQIIFSDDENKKNSQIWNNTFYYEIKQESDFYWLTINRDNFKKKFLLLVSDFILVLYDGSTQEEFFKGISKGSVELYSFPTNVFASSELKEKSKIYYAKNVCNLTLESVWSTDGNKNEDDKKLIFKCNAEEFVLFSGYVSMHKPWLWKQNSRPKHLKINLIDKNEYKEFKLEDTPNPQHINLGFIYYGKVEIEILDIYPGSKYNDICISAVLTKY